jgi:predicted enzyme related to lactoylglutathione lyase
MPPTLANGKICYIEMPATDVERSANFYKRVFGWNIRKHSDGRTSFDDTTGEVSGMWTLGREPASEPGLLFYVMVDSVAATIDAIARVEVRSCSPSARMRPRLPPGFATQQEM